MSVIASFPFWLKPILPRTLSHANHKTGMVMIMRNQTITIMTMITIKIMLKIMLTTKISTYESRHFEREKIAAGVWWQMWSLVVLTHLLSTTVSDVGRVAESSLSGRAWSPPLAPQSTTGHRPTPPRYHQSSHISLMSLLRYQPSQPIDTNPYHQGNNHPTTITHLTSYTWYLISLILHPTHIHVSLTWVNHCFRAFFAKLPFPRNV